MKLCGHTMGTPDKDIFEAISFFAELGLDGIEVRCADNGQMDIETITDDLTGKLLDLLIMVRQLAREKKQFDIADSIRDELAGMHIVLEDHPQGTIWKKKAS